MSSRSSPAARPARLLLAALFGERFTLPPIAAVATLPGSWGELAAFAAEVAIAFVLMTTVLTANASARLMRWTGVCAGVLVALYIAIEAPVSGMSLNPARSVASALPSGIWHGIWIYLTAPALGMLLAAELHVRRGRRTPCAKLHHDPTGRCIFHCELRGREPGEQTMSHDHYDVIIIGSGAGGGTLAYRLAPSGKRILILERGDFLPREQENWSSEAVFGANRYKAPETWHDRDGKPFHPGIHY